MDYTKTIKTHIRNYLTECPVKLSSENFESKLIKFLEERGVNNVSHVNVNKLNVVIILAIDRYTTARLMVTKEIFK